VNFDVPAGACDCHTHIHGDVEKFPFFSGRVYTPEPASPEEMSALHKALHIDRVVIVTPSVYGTDWPHPDSSTVPGRKPTDVAPLFQIDDGRLLNQLPVWAPDAAIRKKILVDNPARLYGF